MFICPQGHYIEAELERYYSGKKYVWCRYCWALILKSKCEVRDMKISKEKYGGGGIPFFKARDMKGESVTVTITGFREQELPSGTTPVIEFTYNKQDRSLPLNQTNLGRLIIKFGDDTDKWKSRKITLYTVNVTNPRTKEEVESIRIRE